jgi:hypothetical protein
MAKTIYKMFQTKLTEAWYQLSKEERDALMSKVSESLKSVGAKSVVTCSSVWSSEQYVIFGVEEYPDIEAVQKHTENLWNLNWFRYIESTSTLGTKLWE